MTSSNMVLGKTASYFRLVIRGHGDSHFQIRNWSIASVAAQMYRVVQHLEGFFSRIDENHWLLPSPIRSESSHCYLRTSIQATIDGSTARRCIAIVTNERRASYDIPLNSS